MDDQRMVLAALEIAAGERDRADEDVRDLIARAGELGISLRRIGRAAGLSHQRIGQMLNEGKDAS
jgi:hypothetical protein